MLDILKQLKDFDSDMDDERLRSLGDEVEQLIDGMQKNCYQLYKLILTTPTFTEEELRARQEATNISQQEAAARLAALNASKSLPPMQAKSG